MPKRCRQKIMLIPLNEPGNRALGEALAAVCEKIIQSAENPTQARGMVLEWLRDNPPKTKC